MRNVSPFYIAFFICHHLRNAEPFDKQLVLDREFSNKFLCGIIIIINVVVITIEKR